MAKATQIGAQKRSRMVHKDTEIRSFIGATSPTCQAADAKTRRTRSCRASPTFPGMSYQSRGSCTVPHAHAAMPRHTLSSRPQSYARAHVPAEVNTKAAESSTAAPPGRRAVHAPGRSQLRGRHVGRLVFLACLCACLRSSRQDEGGSSPKRLFGLFSTEQTEPADTTTRSKYTSSCFAGFDSNYFDGACYHERSVLQGDDGAPMPDETNNLNNLGVVCLECCSSAVCTDDDFDDSTGNCEGRAYYDVWRLRCPVKAGRTTLGSGISNYVRDKQIRMLRNLSPTDYDLTICEFPRMGKTYALCDEEEFKEYRGTFCNTFVDDPAFRFTCGKDTEHDRQYWSCEDEYDYTGRLIRNAKCECRVPQKYYAVNNRIDDSATCPQGATNCRFVVGYRLVLGVSDEGGGVGGEKWRAVRSCEMTSYETFSELLRSTDWDTFEVKQDIVMQNEMVYSPFDSQNLIFTLITIFGVLLLCLQAVSMLRAQYCWVCGKRMYLCCNRCIYCRFYGAEPPNNTLFRALKARREYLRGKDFATFVREGPVRGGSARVRTIKKGGFTNPKLNKVYVAPKIKEVDHFLSIKRPFKLKGAKVNP